MKAIFQRWGLLLLAFLTTSAGWSQTPEMADGMRSEGKIYVVVAIILVVLIGILFYLFVIDRRVSKLEKGGEGKTQ